MADNNVKRANLRILAGVLAMCSIPAAVFAVESGANPAANTLAVPTASVAANWGSYLTPFAADSLWNSRPIGPVFGTYQLRKLANFPSVVNGGWSTGAFLSSNADQPMVVTRLYSGGVWDPDAQANRPSVRIPRWPAGVLPATEYDGHADIVDPIDGIIHSFYQLKKVNGAWVAASYAWMPLKGRGWGDPAHYFQGSRATGIPAMAGLIRGHEINDGQPVYRHALALSLPHESLRPARKLATDVESNYIFPATSGDSLDPNRANTGEIPEGALLMLPPSFDTSKISNVQLRKVADTLKLYGAYVVDRNYDTPFTIYVENGFKFTVHNADGSWNNTTASTLDAIRASLRRVTSAQSWVDGNGVAMVPKKTGFNLLSMRGPWTKVSAAAPVGTFDTWTQAVTFPPTATEIVQDQKAGTGTGHATEWAKLETNSVQRLSVSATGGAKLSLVVYVGDVKMSDTGSLGDGMSKDILWPSGARLVLRAVSGVNPALASSVKAELKQVSP